MWKDTAFDVFPVLGTRELDTGFQVGSHQNRVEGQNPLPPPAGHNSVDAARIWLEMEKELSFTPVFVSFHNGK